MFCIDPTRKDLPKAKKFDKYMDRVKGILAETDPHFKYPLTEVLFNLNQTQLKELLQGISSGQYLKEVILNLHKVDFEKRKEITNFFNQLMKIKVNALVPYLLTFVKEYIAYIFAKYYL